MDLENFRMNFADTVELTFSAKATTIDVTYVWGVFFLRKRAFFNEVTCSRGLPIRLKQDKELLLVKCI